MQRCMQQMFHVRLKSVPQGITSTLRHYSSISIRQLTDKRSCLQSWRCDIAWHEPLNTAAIKVSPRMATRKTDWAGRDLGVALRRGYRRRRQPLRLPPGYLPRCSSRSSGRPVAWSSASAARGARRGWSALILFTLKFKRFFNQAAAG